MPGPRYRRSRRHSRQTEVSGGRHSHVALRLRRYDPRDADAVWTLHEWAMRDAGTDPDAIPGTEDLRRVGASYLDVGGEFLVGVDGAEHGSETVDGDGPPETFDGSLVAIGGLLPNDAGHADERTVPGAAELHRMRVAPTHQRRGISRRLLAALERAAVDRGFEAVLATTARRQAGAVALYRGAGYEAAGRSREAGYDLVHFEKRLAD